MNIGNQLVWKYWLRLFCILRLATKLYGEYKEVIDVALFTGVEGLFEWLTELPTMHIIQNKSNCFQIFLNYKGN